jgi:superfamily II DNA or RNA helicase
MPNHFELICEQTKKLVTSGKLPDAVKLIESELLRDYQKEGIETIDSYLNSGTTRVLRQAFTGTGKSVEQLYLAMRHIAESPQNKVLFLVPTDELITNLAEYFLSNGVIVSYIKSGRKMLTNTFNGGTVQVFIASVATLVKRLDALPIVPTMILADECHHSPSASWSRCLNYYVDAIKIGFSATPERLDGKSFDTLFDTIVHGKPYKWYIENGYLAPWEIKKPKKFINKLFNLSKGDYDLKEQQDFLVENKVYGDVVKEWETHCFGLKTVVFNPTIEFSKIVVDEYNRYGLSKFGKEIAAHLDGESNKITGRWLLEGIEYKDYRKYIFARFRLPLEHPESLLILSNVALFIEGVSVPSCHVTQWTRKTKSAIIYDQGNGRSNRPEPGKIQYILDHAGNEAEHGTPDRERYYDLRGRKKKQSLIKYHLICPNEKCNYMLAKDYRKLPKQILFDGWVACPECKTPVFIPKGNPKVEKVGRALPEIDKDHEFITISYQDDNRILNLNALFRKYDKQKDHRRFFDSLLKQPNLTLEDLKLACKYRDVSDNYAYSAWSKKMQSSLRRA